MKKILLALFAVLALSFVACQKDADDSREPGPVVDENLLVGTWSMPPNENVVRYVFKDDHTFVCDIYGEPAANGTYSLSGDILTLTDDSVVSTMRVVMLYQNNVMVLCYRSEGQEDWGIADNFELLFRQGASPNTPIGDIQGKWFWFHGGDTAAVRGALAVSGSKFEFIIPVWREFMTGHLEYQNGFITFHVDQFKTRSGNDVTIEHLYDDWHVPGPDDYQQEPSFGMNFSIPFVANGNEAFSIVANLPAYFEKQQ